MFFLHICIYDMRNIFSHMITYMYIIIKSSKEGSSFSPKLLVSTGMFQKSKAICPAPLRLTFHCAQSTMAQRQLVCSFLADQLDYLREHRNKVLKVWKFLVNYCFLSKLFQPHFGSFLDTLRSDEVGIICQESI